MTTSRVRDVARLARLFALALLALAASARASPATPPVVSSDEESTAPWWRGSSRADPRREGTRGDHHQPLSAVDPSRLAVATAEGVHRPDGAWSVPGWSVAVAPDDDAPFRCGDVARVTVTSPAPNASHWIAVYSPARANVTATAPTRYVILHEADPAYLTTGVAVVRVRLVCARADHDVVLFADDWVTRQGWRQDLVRLAVAVARSPRVSVPQADGPRKPRVVVLAPEHDDDDRDDSANVASASSDLAVAWNSGRDATHTPRLRWWLPGSPQDAVESLATTTTFAREDLCGSPADGVGWRHPGYTHVARIVGAPPGRTVAYELLDDAGGRYPAVDEPNAWLAVPREDDRKTLEDDHTETRPETGGASGGSGGSRASRPSSSYSSRYRPFSLAMFADMGRGTDDDSVTWQEYGAPALNVSRALARDAAKGDVDAAFLFGDLSYATGYASVWDDWTEQIAPFAGRVPFLTNPGNHEFDAPPDAWRPRGVPGDVYGGDDSGGECGVPLATFFPTPRKSRDASWWSVAAGPFLILSVNAEASLRPGSPQLEWLRRQLAAVDRVATPWVLFAAHRPALVDSDFGAREPAYRREGGEDYSDVGVALAMQRDVWPLLVDAGVDAAFGGHNHVYQRHCAFDWRTKGDEGDEGDGEGNNDGDGNGNANVDGNAKKNGNATASSVPFSSTWTRGRWPTRETYGEGCVGRPRANADGVSVYDAPRAPVSFVVGSAGAGFTRTATGAAFSEVTAYEYGYLRLVAANRTHLFGEFRETQRGLGTIDRFLVVREETEEEKTGRARLEFAPGRRGPRRAGGDTATATVR